MRVVMGIESSSVALGSLEYGHAVLGSNLIVVLGHEYCGAVDAAEDHAKGMVYLAVDDITYYLEKVKRAGGTVVKDVTVIPDMVTYAIFRDPAGNEIGLVLDDGSMDDDEDDED